MKQVTREQVIRIVNSFRNKGERADLSKANLQNIDLSRLDLSRVRLCEVNLSRVNLSYANLQGADLRYADLTEADLFGADLRQADLRGTERKDCRLDKAKVEEAIFVTPKSSATTETGEKATPGSTVSERSGKKVGPSPGEQSKSGVKTTGSQKLKAALKPKITLRAAPGPVKKQSKRGKIILKTQRKRRVTERTFCDECGHKFLEVWRYAESNQGVVHLCDECKPKVLWRSFHKRDAMDNAVVTAFESNPRKY